MLSSLALRGYKPRPIKVLTSWAVAGVTLAAASEKPIPALFEIYIQRLEVRERRQFFTILSSDYPMNFNFFSIFESHFSLE